MSIRYSVAAFLPFFLSVASGGALAAQAPVGSPSVTAYVAGSGPAEHLPTVLDGLIDALVEKKVPARGINVVKTRDALLEDVRQAASSFSR